MQTIKVLTLKGDLELPLMNIKGKHYLQVAHRVQWFRADQPFGRIETQIISTNDNSTLAKAMIYDEKNNKISEAHKQENKQGFADHLEKAETGAIGRALGLAGYGTQFCPELDEEQRLADSPVNVIAKQNVPNYAPKASPSVQNSAPSKQTDAPTSQISPKQIEWLYYQLPVIGWSNKDLNDFCMVKSNGAASEPKLLTRAQYDIIRGYMQVEVDKKKNGTQKSANNV